MVVASENPPVQPDGTAVVAVTGELDIATAPHLRGVVGVLLGQGVRHLEVDMDECTFIDSTGMGALLWSKRRLEAAGGDICASHVHGAPQRAMRAACLDRVIKLTDSD